MRIRVLKSIAWAFPWLLAANIAGAEISLRYSPADTVIGPGDSARISIILDQVQDIRTIEVFAVFDTSVVRSLTGGPGELFSSSGFTLFKGFEEIEPGQWHGYVVVLGSGDFVNGPGELFYWNIEGLAPGVSALTTLEIGLADGNGSILSDVSLDPTTIVIDYQGSGVEDLPVAPQDVQLWPNPFNPRVNVRFAIRGGQWARLAVFDLKGNLVSTLFEGVQADSSGEQYLDRTWEGQNDHGQKQPGGVYLFRLETAGKSSVRKGVLLK